MTTMIVLVNLKEGVSPEEYESWVKEIYLPAVTNLESVDAWRGYRVGGRLESDAASPYRYVVFVEVRDQEQLGKDLRDERTRRLLAELGRYAEPPVQVICERFI